MKAEESKIGDLSLEKKNLTEENELIKGKINSVVNEKTVILLFKYIYFLKKKMEEVNSSGNREMKIKYEETKENISKLEEYIKMQTETNNSRLRDLENKLIQERLKFDQKLRDYVKLGLFESKFISYLFLIY